MATGVNKQIALVAFPFLFYVTIITHNKVWNVANEYIGILQFHGKKGYW